MIEISFDEGAASMLDSLLAQRLALLAGAELSMSPPSNLPSARRLLRTQSGDIPLCTG
jgi:hypothetical protein